MPSNRLQEILPGRQPCRWDRSWRFIVHRPSTRRQPAMNARVHRSQPARSRCVKRWRWHWNTILSCMLTPGKCAQPRRVCYRPACGRIRNLRQSLRILPAARISPVPGRSRPRSVWRRPFPSAAIYNDGVSWRVCRRSWRVGTTKRRDWRYSARLLKTTWCYWAPNASSRWHARN